jgi:hypothetical protein
MKENEYCVKIRCGNCGGSIYIIMPKGEFLPERTKCYKCGCETHTNHKIGLMPRNFLIEKAATDIVTGEKGLVDVIRELP